MFGIGLRAQRVFGIGAELGRLGDKGMVFEALFPFGNVHAAPKETFQERYSKVWLLDAHSVHRC